MMNYLNDITEAIDTVSSWNLGDECFADAVNQQAMLVAGLSPESFVSERNINNPYRPLRF